MAGRIIQHLVFGALLFQMLAASPVPDTALTLVGPVGIAAPNGATLAVTNIGVDSQGKTTYIFATEVASKTVTATVVAASGSFHQLPIAELSVPIGLDCNVGQNIAICNVLEPSITATETEPVETAVFSVATGTPPPKKNSAVRVGVAGGVLGGLIFMHMVMRILPLVS
ncbi:hypothetical protein R3P38DRAFT_3174114 [Favolaschia claudopus]|uniref:Transmembrane protein n=1 Tax=Favolaschia claudopus TaxID=2862362 RepID=A0AAW0DGF8_9AGAR